MLSKECFPQDVVLCLPGLLLGQGTLTNKQESALARLLSRARCQQNSQNSVDACVRAWFNGLGPNAIPSGALSALAVGDITEEDPRIWCRADPVEYELDQHRAWILGNDHLALTLDEAQQLQSDLSPLFTDQGHALHCLTPIQWVCSLAAHTEVVMNDLGDCYHRDLLPLMPSGPDGKYWHRLLTECQMACASSLVNAKRDALPGVSGLWFWGLGKLPGRLKSPFTKVYSSDLVLQGLAKRSNLPVEPFPNAFPFEYDDKMNHHAPQKWLLYDQSLYDLAKTAQFDRWQTQFDHIEQHYFEPLLQALKAHKIHSLTLSCADGRLFTLKPRYLNYVWRRVRSLETFVIS